MYGRYDEKADGGIMECGSLRGSQRPHDGI